MAPRNRAEAAGQAAAGAARTALNKAPGSKLAQGLQRVSPGVYRNAAGQLTNSGGKAMPGQESRVPRPSTGVMQGVAQGAGAAMGGRQMGGGNSRAPRPLTGRPMGGGMRPQMGGGMAEAIGAGMGAGMGSAMGGGMEQRFNDMMQRFGGPKDDQTMQAEAAAMARQAAMEQAGFGPIDHSQQGPMGGTYDDFRGGQGGGMGGITGGFAGGIFNNGRPVEGGQQPGLEEMARSRAEAISRGDMVTMDYNPQREALVNQYLQQMQGGQGAQAGQAAAGMAQGFGQGFGMGKGPGMQAPQGMGQPGTVSGLLQRGPAQRPNPFGGFAQGIGQQFGGMPMNPYKR